MQDRSLSRLPTRKLWAMLALSAVTLAATPTYSESTKNHPEESKGDIRVGMIQVDPSKGDNGGFLPDTTVKASGTWKVYPNVKTYLTAFVLYNTKTCAEITPGQWVVKSSPNYGNLYGKFIKGHLADGVCPSHTYTFDAIYYKWVIATTAKTDEFKANWKADGNQIDVTFHLDLK